MVTARLTINSEAGGLADMSGRLADVERFEPA